MGKQTKDISVSNIWSDDRLDRKIDGQNLLYFLEKRFENKSDENGFVIAVNGKWGVGKSFFVERLHLEAIKRKHPVMFFNAWSNDFTKDPLLAFISEFNASLSAYFKKIPVSPEVKRKIIKVFMSLPVKNVSLTEGLKFS